jgi:hypothetical protein
VTNPKANIDLLLAHEKKKIRIHRTRTAEHATARRIHGRLSKRRSGSEITEQR